MACEDCPLSSASPDRVALAPSLTYGELHLLVARGAAALECERGDLIALQADPNWKTIALLFAAWRAGVIVALFPPNLPPLARAAHLANLSPRQICADPFAETKFFSNTILDLDAPALMLLTSGSSGSPKWASFSLSQLFESARTVATALNAQTSSRWLLSIPLHHVGGFGILLRSLLSGGTLYFENKSLSHKERISSINPDFASLVPTQLYRLLKEPMEPLKTHFLIGGAPLPETLYRTALSRGYRLSVTYGLTEMSSTVLFTETPKWDGPFAYLGEPLSGRKLSLSPENELLVSGKCFFNGYGFPPNLLPTPFPTGDLGQHHPKFGWSIRGRKDFQFLSGGENIQPEEIEAALLSHPDVEEAIVVPLSDVEFGARPAAFVRSCRSDAELIAYLSDRLPKYKIPVVFESLEEGIGFKPNRFELYKQRTKELCSKSPRK